MTTISKEIKFTLAAEELEQCKPWMDFGTDINDIVHDVSRRFLQDYRKDLGETKQYGFSHDYEMSQEGDGKV